MEDDQYCGGCSVMLRDTISCVRGTIIAVEGYRQYFGRNYHYCRGFKFFGEIFSTVGRCYCEEILSMLWRDTISAAEG